MKIKQLFEKIAKGYIPIYPLASMQSIIDDNQSITLAEILNRYNHIYVTYKDNVAKTRCQIPELFRRYGLWISYEKSGGLYTEYFKGSNVDAQQSERWSADDYWEYVPDLQYVQDASLRIPNDAILPEHLSDSLQQLISEQHTIYNLVDDEDLTEKGCGIIKFKDKDYQPTIASGKGYKILRKCWVNGINVLTNEDVAEENTIYEVRYDFDLQGCTLSLPYKGTLLFKGGSINNGTVVFNEGTIIGADKFSDCGNASFTGNWSKGLIMSFDDSPKWWNGTEWIALINNEEHSANTSSNVEILDTYDIADRFTINVNDYAITNSNYIIKFFVKCGDDDISDGSSISDTNTSYNKFVYICFNLGDEIYYSELGDTDKTYMHQQEYYYQSDTATKDVTQYIKLHCKTSGLYEVTLTGIQTTNIIEYGVNEGNYIRTWYLSWNKICNNAVS